MRKVRVIGPGEPADDDGPDPSDDTVPSGGRADNRSVILETEDGERLVLAVDDALLAAVAATEPQPDPESAASSSAPADPPAPTSPPSPPSPKAHPLTPREIQVRVRAGESPEDLATESGTALDRIMLFASAVLEERIRIGDEARRARARHEGDGILVPFGETVDRRFAVHGIDPATVLWDSFRRPDGSWVVIATWTSSGTQRRAHWAFSLAARTVLPADEIGSDLLSDRPLRPVVRAVPDRPEPSGSGSGTTDSADAAVADEHPPRYDEAYAELYDQDAPPSSSAARSAPGPAVRSAAQGPPAERPAPPQPLRLAAAPVDTAADTAADGPDADTASYVGLDDLFGRPRLSSAASPDADREASSGAGPAASASDPGGRTAASSRFDRSSGTDEPAGGQPAAGQSATELSGTDAASPAEPGTDAAESAGPDSAAESGGDRRRNSRGKAAREQTRIPSWDDILLGVRRKQD